MRKVKVLFFTADPIHGRPNGVPLELLEEFRQIKVAVAEARYRHRLVLELLGSARAHDLMDLLEHTDAQVVHFSGHGGHEGLVLVGRDGRSRHPVNAATLKAIFRRYHGPVRLAVLSACTSDEEAQAIADVVGCAIGTTSDISDRAAITFNSRFYRSVANGHSVGRAFDEACMALQLDRVPESEHPKIFVRHGVDADDVVLVKTYRPLRSRLAVATVAGVTTAIFTLLPPRPVPRELTASDIACGAQAPLGITSMQAIESGGATSTTSADPVGVAQDVANANALYGARRYGEAAQVFAMAAEAGSGEAMGCLGHMYLHGIGVDSQPATGYEWVHTAATKERDPHGMYALALAYLNGNGTERREWLAKDWLEKSAELGFADAMRVLGDLSRQRMNDSSYQQALAWYQSAVNAGSVNARVDLGVMYEFGWGVPRNADAALRWYRSAAAVKSSRGMFAVGQSYQKGLGVAADYDQAMAWYRRAAKAGVAEAMNSIGALYEDGLGVRKSRRQALRWYQRAAQAGSTLGTQNLHTLRND